jgi:hypothetical protein
MVTDDGTNDGTVVGTSDHNGDGTVWTGKTVMVPVDVTVSPDEITYSV